MIAIISGSISLLFLGLGSVSADIVFLFYKAVLHTLFSVSAALKAISLLIYKVFDMCIGKPTTEFLSMVNFSYLAISVALAVSILISVAFMTLAERKLMASIQGRRGPVKTGLLGLLQPFSDGAKLLLKETVLPRNSYFYIFVISPILAFICGFAI